MEHENKMKFITDTNHKIKNFFIQKIAAYLETPSGAEYHPSAVPDPDMLRNTLKPCDIILVEGDLRYSEIIKYVTQSTWSHCGLYIGDAYEGKDKGVEQKCIVEALLTQGVTVSPLKDYYGFNTRILRPIGLTKEDKEKIINFCLERVGHSYDIRNVLDLFKYHIPFLRIFFAIGGKKSFFGAGDPQRVICSSLLAQAFHHISYPILLDIEKMKKSASVREGASADETLRTETELLRKRHHSLFCPRDFDVSPFFSVVKPTLEDGFNYKGIKWSEDKDYF